jgi:hypothetical protein
LETGNAGPSRDFAEYLSLGRDLAAASIGDSSHAAYQGSFRIWRDFLTPLKGRAWISEDPEEARDEILAFMAYCYGERGNGEQRIACNLSAVNYFHKVHLGREIPVKDTLVGGAKRGIDRKQGKSRQARREKGIGAKRAPFTSQMIHASRPTVSVSKKERVLWCGLALSYHLLLRASELWADNGTTGRVTEYGLRRRHLSWFKGERQLAPGQWKESDRVEILFDGSKADGKRLGAVLSRGNLGEGVEGGWSILMQLMGIYEDSGEGGSLGPDSPLMAYKDSEGAWKVWNRAEALVAMRRAAIISGEVNPGALQLHSARVGGATALAAMGVSTQQIMIEGRWKGDSFMEYIRQNRREAEAADRALARVEGIRIPGRGTVWQATGGGGWTG